MCFALTCGLLLYKRLGINHYSYETVLIKVSFYGLNFFSSLSSYLFSLVINSFFIFLLIFKHVPLHEFWREIVISRTVIFVMSNKSSLIYCQLSADIRTWRKLLRSWNLVATRSCIIIILRSTKNTDTLFQSPSNCCFMWTFLFVNVSAPYPPLS